jgi:ABC-type lipoprotein export system ATPase subunit
VTQLLELERVSKRHRHGEREHVVLREVSLSIEAGELVAVWGLRHSGRSTLLRVAGGLEPPDSGTVLFAGRPLVGGNALGGGIGWCRRSPGDTGTHSVLDELLLGALACGIPRSSAHTRAFTALERVDAGDCAPRAMHELDGAETVRVTVARALMFAPKLLVIDDPVKGVDLLERDVILELLRSLADERIAVLISVGEATALAGADRALSLAGGELRGSVLPELAPVLPLRRPASG